MIPRYQSKEVAEIFSDENRFKTWFLVEIEYLESSLAHRKESDSALIARLRQGFDQIHWTDFVQRVESHERLVKHDVIAFLMALEDILGPDARMLHRGL